MKIEINSAISKDVLERLIVHHKYGRFGEDIRLTPEMAQSYELHRISSYLERESVVTFLAVSDSGEALGLLLARLSLWDTEHFGYRVAVIDYVICNESPEIAQLNPAQYLVRAFDKWCLAKDVRFASVRLSGMQLQAIHVLEEERFHYIESYIKNVFELSRLGDRADHLSALRPIRPEELGIMLDFSQNAFADQRFHADANIDPTKAESLYRKWIHSAFNDPKREILVMDIDEQAAAFAICFEQDHRPYLDTRSITTEMAVTNPGIRGKGLGTDLFLSLFRYYRDCGVDVIYSGLTMRNLTSLNWHSKLGFRTVSVQVTFHKWYDHAEAMSDVDGR